MAGKLGLGEQRWVRARHGRQGRVGYGSFGFVGARQARLGASRCVCVRRAEAGCGRQVRVGYGSLRSGRVRQGRRAKAWFVEEGAVWSGRHVTARCGRDWLGAVRCGVAGTVWRVEARLARRVAAGIGRRGIARFGTFGKGLAGKAAFGSLWPAEAWRGLVWQGRQLKLNRS